MIWSERSAGVRRVLLVTGSRGEWGYIRPIMRRMAARDDIEHRLVVTNMHVLPEFGSSLQEIRNDGFEIEQTIYMALDSYTDVSMSKSLGLFLLSFSDTVDRLRPDFILLAGDRGEQLMAAIAGAHMNVPVAHVQAGEVSGNIDGLTRHAIARYAHLHFAANDDAGDRLKKSGEQDFRVHVVGAPQLDEFLEGDYATEAEVTDRFHLCMDRPFLLLAQHPVTEQVHLAAHQMETTLRALDLLQMQTVLIYPNNDAGSGALRTKIDEYRRPWLHVERNVSRRLYAGLMRGAAVMVGNSSSGLIEAPSFGLPAVNIGRRQEGRYQGPNVVNVDHDVDAIVSAVRRAMCPSFREALRGEPNPYGDGLASSRIVDLLATLPIDERLLFKAMTY